MLHRLIILKNIEACYDPLYLFCTRLYAFHPLIEIQRDRILLRFDRWRNTGVISTRESISGLNLYTPTILPFSIRNSNESSGSTTIEEGTSSVSFP